MSTPIINAQMDAINGSMATLKGDLTTLRPLIKTLKETALNAYATESLSNQAIASFTDGANNVPVKSLSAAITPIQNLNGQSSPYPAGGGKNKLKVELTSDTTNQVTFTVNADGTISLSGTANALTVRQINQSVTLPAGTYTVSGCPSGGGNSSYSLRVGNVIVDETGNGATFTLNAETTTSVSLIIRNGVNVTGKVFKPMICLSTATDPTVFAPYSNICPISGHTEVNVTRTGKNLLSGIYAGQISSTTGQESTGTLPICAPIKVKPSTAYTLSPTATNGAVRFFEYDANGNFIKTATASGTAITGGYKVTYTTSATTAYLRFQSTATIIPFDGSYQLEEGSTATAYEPFGTVYPISLGQTVYGGTLNVTTGVLTIDRAMVDLGELTWNKISPRFYSAFSTTAANCPKAPENDSSYVANAICSQYSVTNRLHIEAVNNSFSIHNAGASTYLTIVDSRYTSGDAAAFKTAMSGVQLVYELATPTTVQLTPTEVTTLLGQNNIWADTGDITEVTIRCDTALYIQKLVG